MRETQFLTEGIKPSFHILEYFSPPFVFPVDPPLTVDVACCRWEHFSRKMGAEFSGNAYFVVRWVSW